MSERDATLLGEWSCRVARRDQLRNMPGSLNNAAHVRSAMSRFSSIGNSTNAATRIEIAHRIVDAARRFGVDAADFVRAHEELRHPRPVVKHLLEVSFPSSRHPTLRVMYEALTLAESLDCDTVSFLTGGPFTVRRCRQCTQPVIDGPTHCDWCSALDRLRVVNEVVDGRDVDKSPLDIHHQIERAEWLAGKVMEVALELRRFLEGDATKATRVDFGRSQRLKPLEGRGPTSPGGASAGGGGEIYYSYVFCNQCSTRHPPPACTR